MNEISGKTEHANQKAERVRNILVSLQELLQVLNARSSVHHDLQKTIDCMQEELNGIKADLQREVDTLAKSFSVVRSSIAVTSASLRSLEKIIGDNLPETVDRVQIPSFSRINQVFRNYNKMRRKTWRKQLKALAELTEEVNDPTRPWEVIQFHFEADEDYYKNDEESSKSIVSAKKFKLSRVHRRNETTASSKEIAIATHEDELFAQFLEQEAERLQGSSKAVASPVTPPRKFCDEHNNNGTKESIRIAPSLALGLQRTTRESKDAIGSASSSQVLQELNMNKPSQASRSTDSVLVDLEAEEDEDINAENLVGVQKLQAKEYSGPEYAAFEAMELFGALLSGLHIWGIANPKPLQQSLVPCILTGRDTIVESGSQSGKTTAAIVCALQKIDYAVNKPQVLHLQPTAEIATKTLTKIMEIGTWLDAKATCCSKTDGSADASQIFTGTPSRVRELIIQRKLSIDLVKMLIVDTADVILATSTILVGKLLYLLPNPERVQVIVLTEKVTKEVSELVSKLKTPEYIQFSEDKCDALQVLPARHGTPCPRPPYPDEIEIIYSSVEEATQNTMKEFNNLSQIYEVVENDDVKIKVLHELSDLMETEQAIIFCNSGAKADWLARKIREYQKELEVCSVHGQCGNRDHLIELFKVGVSRVLITTDFITRWNVNLIPVPLVLNFEFPEVPEQYMQRLTYAGRTAKAGKTPPTRVLVFSFVSNAHLASLHQLARKYKFGVSPMSYRS